MVYGVEDRPSGEDVGVEGGPRQERSAGNYRPSPVSKGDDGRGLMKGEGPTEGSWDGCGTHYKESRWREVTGEGKPRTKPLPIKESKLLTPTLKVIRYFSISLQRL